MTDQSTATLQQVVEKGQSEGRDEIAVLGEILSLARSGDEAAMRILLCGEKESGENLDFMLEPYGDLARVAEEALIEAHCGNDLIIREGLVRRLSKLREDLKEGRESPLEAMIIDLIVCCWIQSQHVTQIYGQSMNETNWKTEEYFQKLQDKVQRRYLNGIKSLAQIRKLGPAIQVNIAEKQINVQATK